MAHGEPSRSPAKLCLRGLPAMPSHAELVSTGTNPALPLLAQISPPAKPLALWGSTPSPRPRCRRIDHPVTQRGWLFGFAGANGKAFPPTGTARALGRQRGPAPSLQTHPEQTRLTTCRGKKKKMQNKSKEKSKRNKDEDAGINPPGHPGA